MALDPQWQLGSLSFWTDRCALQQFDAGTAPGLAAGMFFNAARHWQERRWADRETPARDGAVARLPGYEDLFRCVTECHSQAEDELRLLGLALER